MSLQYGCQGENVYVAFGQEKSRFQVKFYKFYQFKSRRPWFLRDTNKVENLVYLIVRMVDNRDSSLHILIYSTPNWPVSRKGLLPKTGRASIQNTS